MLFRRRAGNNTNKFMIKSHLIKTTFLFLRSVLVNILIRTRMTFKLKQFNITLFLTTMQTKAFSTVKNAARSSLFWQIKIQHIEKLQLLLILMCLLFDRIGKIVQHPHEIGQIVVTLVEEVALF